MSTKYLIVGDGRLARHFLHYFDLSAIPCIHCKREDLGRFKEFADSLCDADSDGRILLLINDDQIQSFIRDYKGQAPAEVIWVHCSGVLSIDGAESAHPMASFSRALFDDNFYSSIPFITEKGRMNFAALFPEFPNPNFEITKEQKELYHAWCSIAGNFSTMLWLHFYRYLQQELHMPKQTAYPYIKSISDNLIRSDDPLTGPIKRGDTQTINRHLKWLKNTPMEDVYQSFINLYEKSKS